jgi:biopolymer transport protein TolR
MSMAAHTSAGAQKNRLMADINVTPMVDVMLVLLVIFMVTAPLLLSGVNVDLPRNAGAKLDPTQKPVVVTLAADGTLYAGDEKVDRAAFLARLSDLKAKGGVSAAYVRADRKIAYGEVLQVLGLIGQAGFQRISLVAQADDATANLPAITPAGGSQ